MDLSVFEPKNLYILETHNWYDAQNFKTILNYVVGHDEYKQFVRTKRFKSHYGEDDHRTYWKFITRVDKEREMVIRQLVSKSMVIPNWSIEEVM